LNVSATTSSATTAAEDVARYVDGHRRRRDSILTAMESVSLSTESGSLETTSHAVPVRGAGSGAVQTNSRRKPRWQRLQTAVPSRLSSRSWRTCISTPLTSLPPTPSSPDPGTNLILHSRENLVSLRTSSHRTVHWATSTHKLDMLALHLRPQLPMTRPLL
jgi:hypothetical protein